MPDHIVTLDDFLKVPRIASFTMEVALRSEIPTYAGGLGLLAGDTLRSAADLELPMVVVSLVSRRGYFRQSFDAQGRQVESPDPWEPSRWATPLKTSIAVTMDDRQVWVFGWLYVHTAPNGTRQPVILLDTDSPLNHPSDRPITHVLYGAGERYRLKQDVVLGIGGVRLLRALGFQVRHYQMNDGHSALLTVPLLERARAAPGEVRPGEPPVELRRVREQCSLTTHAPVDDGPQVYSWALVKEVLGDEPVVAELEGLLGSGGLCLSKLALELCGAVNGVARRHAEVSPVRSPGSRVHAVAHGVHPFSSTSAPFASLYDRFLPGWVHDPHVLSRAERIPDDELWAAHRAAKRILIDAVQLTFGQRLDPEHFTIGFAHRMTAAERPGLLFSDLGRLRALAARWPLQVVLAGKAHPTDQEGKGFVEWLHGVARELEGQVPVAFLPNSDLELTLKVVAGADVWLNTPVKTKGASSTSGMKAAFNGVPNLSVLDGWWLEGCVEGVTGWSFGEAAPTGADGDAASLYERLEEAVLPRYQGDRAGWIAVMKGAIAKNASFFTSHRLVYRSATEAFLG